MAPLRLALAAALLIGAAALRAAPAKSSAESAGAAKASAAPTPEELERLQKRLGKMASGLQNLLAAGHGESFDKNMAPMLKTFLSNLKTTLKDIEGTKDPAAKAKKLQDAQAAVASLTKDLMKHQESIMQDDEDKSESLLLGVLMSKTKEPMEQQLEVLKSKDFARLNVAQALLKEHDTKTPLFKQAAAYIDKHGKQARPGSPLAEMQNQAQTVADSLQKRVDILEREDKKGRERHAKIIKELSVKAKTGAKEDQHVTKMLLKREERKFKKWDAMSRSNLEHMKQAVAAVRKGDFKALGRAKDALEKSMKAMQSQSGGFLHLLQLGHMVMRRDCPFCVAQCLDKCHQVGKSYSTCLSSCADAGKSF